MTTPAKNIIESIYHAINHRDIPAAMKWIDDDCIYQDLNFPHPFQGKEAVQQLFEESCQNVPNDLKFVIDEITEGDPLTVGVLWHVELDNIPFPNGRGVSFYRLSEKTGKLIFARDIVEPAIKPGKASFFIIRLVTPLIRKLLQKQTKHNPKRQYFVSIILWLLSGIYIYLLLCSPPNLVIPGEPFWAIQLETLQEVINESVNFFFILPILNILEIQGIEPPLVHPVIQAQFNFAEAWIFMFLPLLLADQRVKNFPKIPLWSIAMFLTNVFLIPYMAIRYNQPIPEQLTQPQKGILARIFGWIGLIIGIIAIAWIFWDPSEFGNLAQKFQYFGEQIKSNRVTIAFCVDLILFTIFQSLLMGEIMSSDSKVRWLRFVPFWGLAVWLIL